MVGLRRCGQKLSGRIFFLQIYISIDFIPEKTKYINFRKFNLGKILAFLFWTTSNVSSLIFYLYLLYTQLSTVSFFFCDSVKVSTSAHVHVLKQ